MSLRKILVHIGVPGMVLIGSAQAFAGATAWNGSYVAEGDCFCSGSNGHEVDSQIVATPIGGQSVSQICARIGAGPKLEKVNGKFNFTVFADAQCGHGVGAQRPMSSDDCVGHKGVAGEDCSAAGPTWDLKKAFSKPAVAAVTISDTAPAPAPATGVSRYIKPQVKSASAKQKDSFEKSEALATTDATPNASSTTPVKKIAQVRAKNRPVVKKIEESPADIRARFEKQLEAARLRAKEGKGQAIETHITHYKGSAENGTLEPVESVAKGQLLPEKTTKEKAVVKQAERVDAEKAAIETVADNTDAKKAITPAPSALAALKLPALTRSSSREFDYIEGMPISYDYGGTGLSVAASVSNNASSHYVLTASAAQNYREVQAGFGIYMTPQKADRLTFLFSAGIEHGRFDFEGQNVEASLSSSGGFLGLATRFVVNNKFELKAGVGYSTFFEGDANVFGSAFYHVNRNIDLTTKAELGDNDHVGFGVRLYY